MKIEFTKMHGTGNDYIYVNTLKYPLVQPDAFAKEWSKPHTGIGSDGLVLIGPSEKGDFSMRIFNADGSEAMMCGNASRCVGKYLYEYGLTDKKEIALETLSGIKTLYLHLQGENVDSVTVDMGAPRDIRTVDLGNGYLFREGTAVNMGNPHLVIFTHDVSAIDLLSEGPAMEHHPLFPNRVNVEFAQILPDGNIRMRVWERGSRYYTGLWNRSVRHGRSRSFHRTWQRQDRHHHGRRHTHHRIPTAKRSGSDDRSCHKSIRRNNKYG